MTVDRPDDHQHPLRRGVVAVIRRRDQWLVIRRARTVAAPLAYCFPGGAIEPGESEAEALCRELREELGVQVTPGRAVWESRTPWNVHLVWWTASLDPSDAQITPAPAEVDSYAWLSIEQILALPDLLPSNVEFLFAVQRGLVRLDEV